MPTPTYQRTKMTHHRCVIRRIPTTLLAHRSVAYQATPSRRKSAMTPLLPRLVLGFAPIHRGEWERSTPEALRKGMQHPQALSRRCRMNQQGFLPTPKKTTTADPGPLPTSLVWFIVVYPCGSRSLMNTSSDQPCVSCVIFCPILNQWE
jgi:hypothetical protein